MKVIQIVPGILEQASGTSYSVPTLCETLYDLGVDLELHVNSGKRPLSASYPFRSHGCWKWPPRLDISPRMKRALKETVSHFDIVHNHGLWNMANIYAGQAARDANCKLIISPRGTMNPNAWKKARLKKTIIWFLKQHRMLKDAACFHATSFEEYRAIRNVGFKSPIAVIPNGVTIPDISKNKLREKSPRQMRRLLFISRITPIKCVDNLLQAWSVVQNDYTEWELHITGVDDRGHAGRMKTLAKRLGVKRVRFTGPVYGVDKTQAFLNADLFVLPTRSENFGIVVAEALGHGIPVITTKGAPWKGIEIYGCGYWIDVGVEPLVIAMKNAMRKKKDELDEMGQRGRAWMQRDFTWPNIGKQMLGVYRWLLKGGNKPDCVYCH